jgi:hypothetical protein
MNDDPSAVSPASHTDSQSPRSVQNSFSTDIEKLGGGNNNDYICFPDEKDSKESMCK